MVNVDFKEIALRYEKELKENCLYQTRKVDTKNFFS